MSDSAVVIMYHIRWRGNSVRVRGPCGCCIYSGRRAVIIGGVCPIGAVVIASQTL